MHALNNFGMPCTAVQTTVVMVHVPSPVLSHLITGSLYLLTTFLQFFYPHYQDSSNSVTSPITRTFTITALWSRGLSLGYPRGGSVTVSTPLQTFLGKFNQVQVRLLVPQRNPWFPWKSVNRRFCIAPYFRKTSVQNTNTQKRGIRKIHSQTRPLTFYISSLSSSKHSWRESQGVRHIVL